MHPFAVYPFPKSNPWVGTLKTRILIFELRLQDINISQLISNILGIRIRKMDVLGCAVCHWLCANHFVELGVVVQQPTDVVQHVHNVYTITCPTSPHQRDVRRKLIQRHILLTKLAMIQTLTLREIYQTFQNMYPDDRVSFARFKSLKPWNVIKAYRETYLCRACEQLRLYVETLKKIVTKLREAYLTEAADTLSDELVCLQNDPPHINSGESGTPMREHVTGPQEFGTPSDGDSESILALVESLATWCELDSKSAMVNALTCSSDLNTASPHYMCQQCSQCSFAQKWIRTLRDASCVHCWLILMVN